MSASFSHSDRSTGADSSPLPRDRSGSLVQLRVVAGEPRDVEWPLLDAGRGHAEVRAARILAIEGLQEGVADLVQVARFRVGVVAIGAERLAGVEAEALEVERDHDPQDVGSLGPG